MIKHEKTDELFIDTVEQQQIDKFVCAEMSRQIHRYIKAMKGSHQHMVRFEARLQELTVGEREQAIARYIDLNRHVVDGLDLKIVLTRAMANYCDTFQYLLELVNDRRRMVYYLQRIREKYIQFHEVYEENGLFGMRSSDGRVLIPARYEFLRTPYIYVDDLVRMPVIAQRDGMLGLILADGEGTEVAPFEYSDISVREDPPYFEATRQGIEGYLSADGTFTAREESDR
ncbi:MAG: hypothetical protein IJV27_02410 [Prevotella sp.]|nr:hypothetical protein [Prevotella sp.]